MALRSAEQKAKKAVEGEEDKSADLLQTPQEMLNTAYKSIRQSTYDQIIDTVLSKTPLEFKGLVVKLMELMGLRWSGKKRWYCY